MKSNFLKLSSVHQTHFYLCISNTGLKANIPMEVAVKSQTTSILSAHPSRLALSPVGLIQSCRKGVE